MQMLRPYGCFPVQSQRTYIAIYYPMQNIISKEENPITEEKTLLYYLGIGKKDDKIPNIGQLTASDWEKLIQKAKQRKVSLTMLN